MKIFSSLAAVMALWLAVSFLIWLVYRIFSSRGGAKQKMLASSALALVDEGSAIFRGLRTRASQRVNAQGNYSSGEPEVILREDVRALLNSIEAQSPYFERAVLLKKKIQHTFDVPDFQALSEILQIRRDIWAASEIFLMENIRELGPELADGPSLESFQAEARALLFGDEAAVAEEGGSDPVRLRLSIAREDALAFQAHIESTIAAELEKSRFPSFSELIAGPWSVVIGTFNGLREIRYLLADAATTAQSLVRAMSSKGLKGAAEELRRVRAGTPAQFATAFERAGGLARQGGQSLKRHYEFVIEAQELRARYAELLASAPNLSDKGKQFLARLELERRAEQVRRSSGSLADAARQGLVVGIAYTIAGLQYVQAKVTPAASKQIAPLFVMPTPLAAAPQASAEPDVPLRVLLLPASSYSGGNHGEGPNGTRRRRPRASISDPRPKAALDDVIAAPTPKPGTRLRDLVTGEATVLEMERPAKIDDEEKPAKKPAAPKPRKSAKPQVSYAEGLKKTSLKELLKDSAQELDREPETNFTGSADERRSAPEAKRGSLLNRLKSLDEEAAQQPERPEAAPEKPKPKGWKLFGSERR